MFSVALANSDCIAISASFIHTHAHTHAHTHMHTHITYIHAYEQSRILRRVGSHLLANTLFAILVYRSLSLSLSLACSRALSLSLSLSLSLALSLSLSLSRARSLSLRKKARIGVTRPDRLGKEVCVCVYVCVCKRPREAVTLPIPPRIHKTLNPSH